METSGKTVTLEVLKTVKDFEDNKIGELKEDLADIREEGGSKEKPLDLSTGYKLTASVTSTVIFTSENAKTFCIACDQNKTYHISKTVTGRFRVAYTVEKPQLDTVTYGYLADDSATEMDITTGADAEYLVFYYYYPPASSATEEETFASITIKTEVNAYTAVDLTARGEIAEIVKIYNGLYSKKGTMSSGNVLSLSEVHNKKNETILFRGDITSFDSCEIGHGRNVYMGASVKINSTGYTVYKYTDSKVEVTSGEHGLSISDFLTITVITNADYSAKIIIASVGGSYTIDSVEWSGANGSPFFALYSGEMTNCTLKFLLRDFSKPIYVFGDSYLSTTRAARWGYYIKQLGYDNWLLDGFAGRTAEQAIIPFRAYGGVGKPKYVLWAMGMNNPDTESAVNEAWKTCTDEVIEYCNSNGIVPVLATIPCTPTQRNEMKNAYVKASGCRYIDFAKAVNGLAYGDTWYAGMLSTDNVHPTDLGGEALAHQAFIDMPELIS